MTLPTIEPARTAEAETAFRRWVNERQEADIAAADRQQLAHMPLMLLQNLYPYEWAFGPRGGVWAKQLDRIETLIDEQYEGNRDDTFPVAFGNTFMQLDSTFLNEALQEINYEAHKKDYPDIRPYFYVTGWDPDKELDPTYYLIGHDLWSQEGTSLEQSNFVDALEIFTKMSLWLPLFTVGGEAAVTAREAYNTFCDTWQIPR